MASCPNINSQEWKTLESAVGKLEAYRDYMETNGEIRTPEEVLNKLELRKAPIKEPSQFSSDPSIEEIADAIANENPGVSLDSLKRTRGMELADKMSKALGVDYEVLTPDQAREITKDAVNPWNGEPAFFFGGKVYLMAGRITTDNVFHEFSHPLVRTIAKENTELFNNLYNEVIQTEEGKAILDEVRSMYPELELTEDNELFKEEVIVKALTKHGKDKVQNIKPQSKFQKVISNILYALKQLLRKVFGQSIKISKLNTDTTINELADILAEGNQIQINTQLVTDEEIIAYNRDQFEQMTSDIDMIKERDMQNSINTFYDTISKQLNTLYNNQNYKELVDILQDQFRRGDLQEIKANLKKHQTLIKNAKDDMINEVNDTKSRSMAMVETLLRLESIAGKMYENMQDIREEGDTQENMHKAYYYGKFIKHYNELIKELETAMRTSNVPAGASVRTLISSIKTNLENAEDTIDDMKAEGAIDAIYDTLEPVGRQVAERYEEILTNLRAKNAPQERIDKVYEEYHGMKEAQYERFKELVNIKRAGQELSVSEQNELDRLVLKSKDGLSISREKIQATIKGQMGDANWFNSYLEGYLYNTDPIVGGLALYTKNAMNELMIVAQQKYNSFAEELRDPLKRAGYNPSMLGKLGERTTFKDKIGYVDPETGEFKEKEVHTFLNQFKDYRYEKARYKKNLEDAHAQWQRTNRDSDYQIFLKAVADQKQFNRDYFHQEYVDEFYDKDELLSGDEIGIEAGYLRGEIFERMKDLSRTARTQEDELAIADDIDNLWREYHQLHSRTYEDGTMKIGKDASVAQRLREYRDASREFYEWKIRKGAFENEYFNYKQELRSRGVKEKSPEWDQAMANWKKVNTRKTIKPEFYDRRNDIIFEIKEIMSKLSDAERKDLDQSEVWEDILDKTAGYRDHDNQLNGTEMSDKTIADVKELQEKLEQIKESGLRRSGLSREDEQTLQELYARSKTDKSVWPKINELNEKKKNQGGLNPLDINRLNTLYSELAELSSKEATTYYAEQANAIIAKIDPRVLEKTKFQRDYGNMNIDGRSADYLLNAEVVEELSSISPEFAEWHSKNHISKKKWDKATKQEVDTYERLYMWSVTKPSDPSMMESYDIKDAAGRVIETIEGLPALKYYSRSVKVKYKNRKIRGVTIDNQGQWMPKTMADGAKDDRFINEKYEALKNSTDPKDQALFESLEIMTKYHLDNQESLPYRSRLGYDVPRYRKANLELARDFVKDPITGTKKKAGALTLLVRRFKDFFRKTADQSEDGMSYDNNFNLVRSDIFDNEMTDIPISGLFDIDVDDVSMDVTTSLNRYMLSAERQKQLVKISPVVRAIQSTVNNPKYAIDDINKVHEKNFKASNVLRYFKKDKNTRAAAVNNWIEKHFEGVTQKGFGADNAFVQNFSNFLFKKASFSFFAMNIPSALKNSLGMKFQAMLEASAGRYVNHANLQRGNWWSYRAMTELSSTQIYNKGAKSHMYQLVQVFDPAQGRFEEKMAEGMSRTFGKDIADFNFVMSPRKWVELQANLQVFGGMMYQKKVKIKTPDGSKDIEYMDAFETVDGQIRLKEGIDVRYGLEPIFHAIKAGDTVESIAAKYNIPEADIQKVFSKLNIEEKLDIVEELEELREEELNEVNLDDAVDELERTKMLDIIEAINRKYDREIQEKGSFKIDNAEFKFYKNRIQQVMNNLGGAYSQFDQPEAQRYVIFRWFTYLRRFFTTMFVNRWGFRGSIMDPKPRLNPGTGDAQMGFYIQFTKTVFDTIRSFGGNLKYARKEEGQAAMRMLFEVGVLYTMNLLMGLLFGWDPEDDDRLDKLRQKSGALPGPFVGEDDKRPAFDAWGWGELHALHLLMQVRAENEQFNPFTGGIKLYKEMLSLKPIAVGPTVESYDDIYQSIKGTWSNDPKAYYKRDVGPMQWQKKGNAKFYNIFFKTLGVTGKQYDPALAIKNFQSYYVR
jgi:hypothetical protein